MKRKSSTLSFQVVHLDLGSHGKIPLGFNRDGDLTLSFPSDLTQMIQSKLLPSSVNVIGFQKNTLTRSLLI
jgi:hypothetical protein